MSDNFGESSGVQLSRYGNTDDLNAQSTSNIYQIREDKVKNDSILSLEVGGA
jgi:hypothetical protein